MGDLVAGVGDGLYDIWVVVGGVVGHEECRLYFVPG